MITDLSINYECEGLQYFIKVPSEDNNLPYNLAEAFREVIEKSNANADMVIEQLIESFGYVTKGVDV
jgi:hypothetical protein